MSFTIEVQASNVLLALNRLLQAGQELNPVLRVLGEDMVERTKQRFATGTAPDGTPWAPNSDAVLRNLLHSRSSSFKKDGKLSKSGEKSLANKRPLIGESRDLSRQIGYRADSDSLTVFASPVYAAMQQFGGKKSQFPNLWGDIPARPFLPVRPGDQSLYPDEHQSVLDAINAHLQQAWEG